MTKGPGEQRRASVVGPLAWWWAYLSKQCGSLPRALPPTAMMESAESADAIPPIIKKRARPTARIREPSPLVEEEKVSETEEEQNLPFVILFLKCTVDLLITLGSLEELLELRRLRRARQGIDVSKLNKGETKKRKKKAEDDGSTKTPSGLVGAATSSRREDEDDEYVGVLSLCMWSDSSSSDEQSAEMRARRTVRQSNFTQQTNILDVDKHM